MADLRIPKIGGLHCGYKVAQCLCNPAPRPCAFQLPQFTNLQLPILFPCSSRLPEPRSPQLSANMSAEVKVTGQNQEQFLLLAKSAKGAALATLIHQVLEAPGVYVFGELLDMPNVREVGS